jgi:hypothetical protein
MKIKRLIEHYLFNKSVKEMELNKILDKVLKKKTLTEREKGFIELYNSTQEVLMKDYLYLSKNSAFKKITEILESGKKIICDLHDRNGKIGLEIIEILKRINIVDDSFYFEFGFDGCRNTGLCYDVGFNAPNRFEICYFDVRNGWEQIRTYF